MTWSPVTFDAMWRRAVTDGPERIFLRFEGRSGAVTEWTYGEFDRIVEGAAVRLADAGVGSGNSVHLALTNSPTFVAVWLAAIRLGAWIVPSDPMSTALELTEHVSRTKPVVGFCATERSATYHAVPADVLPPTVIDVDESDPDLPWLSPTTPVERPRPAIRDRAAVMFTSGTTGRPKGVAITQANYAFAGATMADACDLTADDRQLVVLPLFHANAQYYSFASAIAVGASVALMPTFSASRFVQQAAIHDATCASLFAGPIRMILARGSAPSLRSPATPLAACAAAGGSRLRSATAGAGARSLALADGSSTPPLRLRHCWFAQNLTPGQYDTIAEWLGCRPRQLYGMTETIPAVVTDGRDEPRCDTMGYVTNGCLVDVVDGEIVVGGEPGITLFAGYLDDPATTADAFRDGWFLTGDRARRDEQGRYTFEGRRSDVLKVAGENVSTVEVEQALAAHPHVADVAVIGVPDAVRDEVPVAIVVPVADAGDHAALRIELEQWCADRLGKAKRPRDYRFVDELPRTSVGKIKKYQLLRSPATQAEADRFLAGARSLASENATQRRKDVE